MTDREAREILNSQRTYLNGVPYTDRYRTAVETAEAALQEREERSKGCEYCNGAPYLFARAWSLPTNFCPMCGRPLKGADNGR